MALSATFTGVGSVGNRKRIFGTFTTATGDSTGTIATGLGAIDSYEVTIKGGGLNTPVLKSTVSSGTITITTDDFVGYSGSFWADGA